MSTATEHAHNAESSRESILQRNNEVLRSTQADLDTLGTRSGEVRQLFTELQQDIESLRNGEFSNPEQLHTRLRNLESRRNYIESRIEYEKARLEAEKVQGAVEGGLDKLKEAVAKMRKSKKKEKFEWIINAIDQGISKWDNKGNLTIKDSDGNSQKECLPVDGLINALQELQKTQGKEVENLNELIQQNKLLDHYRSEKQKGNISTEFDFGKDKKYTSDKDAANAWAEAQAKELETLGQYITTLNKNSKKYFEVHPDMQGDKQHWRTKLEAQHIAGDHRSTGNADSDYQLAMDEMNNRRELVFPEVPDEPIEPELEEISDTTTSAVDAVDATDDTDTQPIDTQREESVVAPEISTSPAVETRRDEQTTTRVERETQTELEFPPASAEDIRPPDAKLFVVDISQIVKRLAWSQAEEKLNEYLNRWKTQRPQEQQQPSQQEGGFWRKLWRGTKEIGRTMKDIATHPKEFVASTFVRLSERGYLQKFYQEALTQIEQDKNLMAEIDARIRKSEGKEITTDKVEKHFKILDNILEQYVEEVASEEEKGERVIDEDVNQEVSNVLYDFAMGDLNSRQDVEQYVQEHIIPMMKEKGLRFHGIGEDAEKSEGLMYASNMFEIAKSYKTYIEQKITDFEQEFGSENRDAIKAHVKGMLALDIQLGLKARDIRDTKPKEIKTWSDKLVDKVQSIPLLGKVFASPTAVGAGTGAIAALALRGMARAPLAALLAAPAVGALFGGFLGAMRRGRDLQYDRGMELRRQGLGQEAGGPRSAGVREYSYEMLALDDVVSRLQSIATKEGVAVDTDDLRYVAEVYARDKLENDAKTVLFSAGVNEGKELGTRIKSMTEMKIALRDLIRQHPNMDPAHLETMIQQEYDRLSDAVADKDDEFKSFRCKEIVKAGAFGSGVGMVAGFIGDMIVTGVQGEFDRSAVARLGSWMTGGESGPSVSAATAMHEVTVPGTSTEVTLPDNFIFKQDGGVLSIVEAQTGNVVADNVTVGADGQFAPATLDQLRTAGWQISENVTKIEGQIFSNQLHDVFIPGRPDVTIQLPKGLDLVPGGLPNSFDMVDPVQGTFVVSGIEFIPGTNQFTPSTANLLRDLGWNVNDTVNQNITVLRDPTKILEELRARYSDGVTPPEDRTWHGNMDPRSRQITSLHNEFYDDKIVGGPSENYPYEHKAGTAEVATSHESVQKGVLDQPVQLRENIRGTIFDGKELSGRNYIDPATGHGVIDVSRGIKQMMQDLRGVNWDGSYDTKFHHLRSLVRGGNMAEVAPKFCVRMYLNDEDFSAGRAFSIPLDETGKVRITDQELLNQVFDVESGKSKVTIEFAYQDEDKGLARVLATKRGGEIDHLSVTEDTTIRTLTHESVEGSTDVDYVMRPPEQDDPFFVVPLPFVPRKAMEKGRHPDMPEPEVFPPVYSSSEEYSSNVESGKEKTSRPESKSRIENIVERFEYEKSTFSTQEKVKLLRMLYQDQNSEQERKTFLKHVKDYSEWLSEHQSLMEDRTFDEFELNSTFQNVFDDLPLYTESEQKQMQYILQKYLDERSSANLKEDDIAHFVRIHSILAH